MQVRQLHSSRRLLKNPYYFFDLQRRQGPPAAAQGAPPRPERRAFDPLATPAKESMEERLKKVFGDLGSREESRKEALLKGITVAGVHVPARPEEPTNCCMSGCVNCVWELYKDEVDEYRTLRAEARKRLAQPQYNHIAWPAQLGAEPAGRREDPQRAVQEAAKPDGDDAQDEDDLNTGIKVFIETEKKIRARKQARQDRQVHKSL